MNIIKIDAFTISGPSVRTNNAAEASGSGKLAALWGDYFKSHPSSDVIYGVYSDYASNELGDYTVTAGTTGGADGVVTKVKSGDYLEFPANGPMPDAIVNAWQSVWKFFSGEKTLERAFETDFEKYTGPDMASIYIGVKKRQG